MFTLHEVNLYGNVVKGTPKETFEEVKRIILAEAFHKFQVPIEYYVEAGMPKEIPIQMYDENFKSTLEPRYIKTSYSNRVYDLVKLEYFQNIYDLYMEKCGINSVWDGNMLYLYGKGKVGHLSESGHYCGDYAMSEIECRAVYGRLVSKNYNKFE